MYKYEGKSWQMDTKLFCLSLWFWKELTLLCCWLTCSKCFFKTKNIFLFPFSLRSPALYCLASYAQELLRVLNLVFRSPTTRILRSLLLTLALRLAFLCPFHFLWAQKSVVSSFLYALPRQLYFLKFSVLQFLPFVYWNPPFLCLFSIPPPPRSNCGVSLSWALFHFPTS